MSQEASVTVVVACYNHARFVRQALASVADQDFAGLRLVVTDDASTDDSVLEIEAALQDLGLDAERIFHRSNRGLCPTFNEALARVRTTYVAFLSADDWMAPHRFTRQVDELEQNRDAAACYSDMQVVSEDGVELGAYSTDAWPVERPDRPFESLLHRNWIPAPSVLLRTQILREVGAYDETQDFEDYDLWLRLSRRYRLVGLAEQLVFYRRTQDSMTEGLNSSRQEAFHSTRARAFAKHLRDDPTLERVVADKLFDSATRSHALQPARWEYVKLMMAATRVKPSRGRCVSTLRAMARSLRHSCGPHSIGRHAGDTHGRRDANVRMHE